LFSLYFMGSAGKVGINQGIGPTCTSVPNMIHFPSWRFMNKIVWDKKALKEVQNFPETIRKELGYYLFKLQKGESLAMPHSKPMPSVGKGCYELRVKGE